MESFNLDVAVVLRLVAVSLFVQVVNQVVLSLMLTESRFRVATTDNLGMIELLVVHYLGSNVVVAIGGVAVLDSTTVD